MVFRDGGWGMRIGDGGSFISAPPFDKQGGVCLSPFCAFRQHRVVEGERVEKAILLEGDIFN